MNESSTAGFRAQLVAGDGTQYPLAGEMKVGRTAACDITIEDSRVSREHALVRVDGEVVTVEDLGSANGTSVNGTQISVSTILRNGDEVRFEEHSFTVEISGAEEDEDATLVSMPADDELTVVSAVTPEPAPAVAVAPAVEPEPTPEPEPAPEPEPTPEPAPVPEAAPPPAPPRASPAPDLPGSWVDDAVGEHTQFMNADDIAPAAPAGELQRLSDQAHLMVLGAGGQVQEASELEPTAGSEADTWEIGRDASRCQIVLGDPSVSASHAQLIHQEGRWKIVKLPGKNPVVVKGEQRLSAFLSDGDEIRLGNTVLVFRAPVGAAAAPPRKKAPAPSVGSQSTGGVAGLSSRQLALAGAALVVLAVIVVLVVF